MRGSGGVEVGMEVAKRGSGRVGKDDAGRSGTYIKSDNVMCRECTK
jgi:hypothetical protein